MKVLLTQDQAITVKNLLIATIANKETNGIDATQERETLNRIGIALLIDELHRDDIDRNNKLTAAN